MRATRLAAVVAVAVLAAVWHPVPAAADEVREAQWHLDALRVAEAHRHSLGGGVTVAVLDSGVDASHPDLRGGVLPGVDVTGQGSDGRDDPAGTGTALAGLIAGHGHGQLAPPEEDEPDQTGGVAVPADGVLGLAPSAAILPVVVAAPGGTPDGETLAAGIDAAVRGGAGVICVGRPLPDHPDVRRELGAAVAAGVVVVVPAASIGDPLARYGGAGLLGAVPAGRDPVPATGSATGAAAGAVVVPAIGTMSTGGQGGYYRYARTSDAAASAVLAGAAALVRAAHPDLPGQDVAYRIERSAEGGPGGGVLELVAALTAELPAAPAPPAPPAAPPPAAPPPASDPAPQPTAPEPGRTEPGGPEPQDWVAAFDSGDWRRWVVAAPLVLFLVVLVAVSVAGARRARRGRS